MIALQSGSSDAAHASYPANRARAKPTHISTLYAACALLPTIAYGGATGRHVIPHVRPSVVWCTTAPSLHLPPPRLTPNASCQGIARWGATHGKALPRQNRRRHVHPSIDAARTACPSLLTCRAKCSSPPWPPRSPRSHAPLPEMTITSIAHSVAMVVRAGRGDCYRRKRLRACISRSDQRAAAPARRARRQCLQALRC